MLLIEVARADYQQDLTEDAVVFALIQQFFELSESETQLLIEEAARVADHAVSLQTFTRRLHEQLTADGEAASRRDAMEGGARRSNVLDKHEDYVVRKVADLLYVPHRDVIRIRNRVAGPWTVRPRASDHSSTKNCFLKRTVKRLGSLLGVTSIGVDDYLGVRDRELTDIVDGLAFADLP